MKPLHNYQLEILKRLLFSESLRYTEMKPEQEMENNQFNFHLTQLMEKGYIQKKASVYSLTTTGKEFANRIDTDDIKIKMQAKLSIWICCKRTTENGVEFLIGTRRKHPFFGKQGFMAGKIRRGESVEEAAMRELKEESNLDGDPQLVMIRHYRVYDQETKELLEDKFMFLCLVENPTGKIKPNAEVELSWIADSEIEEKVQEPFETKEHLRELLDTVKNFNGSISFLEFQQFTKNF